jgi:uncharacterized Zn finger protein (UPF0148 family)
MRNKIIEDMMPVDCPRCGDINDLDDMYRSKFSESGELICPECHREEQKEIDRLAEIEYILESMENGMIEKREGKKQLKELGWNPEKR